MCIAASALKAVMQVFSCESQFLSKSNKLKSHLKKKGIETRQSQLLKCCAKEKEFLTIFKKNNFFGALYFKNKNLRLLKGSAFVNFLKNDPKFLDCN
jgi:hypothetical protein